MLKRHKHKVTGLLLPALLAVTSVFAGDISAARQYELMNLLKQDCGSCHGMTMQGGLGPALTPQALSDKPKAAMVATILITTILLQKYSRLYIYLSKAIKLVNHYNL